MAPPEMIPQPERDDYVDMTEVIDLICDEFGVDKTYVREIHLQPMAIQFVLWRGKEGRFKGPKYVDPYTGSPAVEEVSYPIRS